MQNNILEQQRVLFKLTYGMYVVTAELNGKLNGQIATTVMQVTNDPIKISVCLSKTTLTHEMVLATKNFGVSILSQETPMTFIGHFGFRCGRDCDKCAGINFIQKITKCPLITDYSLAAFEVSVETMLDIGTHTIFVGPLLSTTDIQDGIPLTYDYYHRVIKGKSPANAPTYVKPENKAAL
jgi:ferric-chelate reductase [NAD(P)H]